MMDQETVKKKLLEVRNDVPPFDLIFSGKMSRKVHGLYKPDESLIILHNKNFSSEGQYLYTALHEFAHHIHFTMTSAVVSSKSHTTQYWSIFHQLLADAEKKGIYTNIFKKDPRFLELTDRIRRTYLTPHGDLMKNFGNALLEAFALCTESGAAYEDYLDRELGFGRNDATACIRSHQYDLDTSVGFDAMKVASRIKDADLRTEVIDAYKEGQSTPVVKTNIISPDRYEQPLEPEDPKKKLVLEKEKLEKSIAQMIAKLEYIEKRLNELQ